MTKRPDCPLLPASLGVTEPKRPVKDAGLLGESHDVSLTVRCVSKQIEGSAVETESSDITSGLVACVVLRLTLGKFDIPLIRQGVIPFG